MPKGTAIQLNDVTDTGELFDLKVQPVYDQEGKILSGLTIGATTEQNKAMILVIQPGENKEFPTLGVGLADCLLDNSDLLAFRHAIRRNFAMDGLNITRLELYNVNNIDIKATY